MMRHEAKGARDFYAKTREMLPDAQLFSALGNHDIRIFDYIDKKLPDYAKDVTPESLWSLDSLGYEYIYYDSLPKRRFGDVHVHHGISIAATGSVRKDMEDLQVYTQHHDWQKGFAIAHIVNDYPHIQMIHIAPDYSCVVDGKTFSL